MYGSLEMNVSSGKYPLIQKFSCKYLVYWITAWAWSKDKFPDFIFYFSQCSATPGACILRGEGWKWGAVWGLEMSLSFKIVWQLDTSTILDFKGDKDMGGDWLVQRRILLLHWVSFCWSMGYTSFSCMLPLNDCLTYW